MKDLSRKSKLTVMSGNGSVRRDFLAGNIRLEIGAATKPNLNFWLYAECSEKYAFITPQYLPRGPHQNPLMRTDFLHHFREDLAALPVYNRNIYTERFIEEIAQLEKSCVYIENPVAWLLSIADRSLQQKLLDEFCNLAERAADPQSGNELDVTFAVNFISEFMQIAYPGELDFTSVSRNCDVFLLKNDDDPYYHTILNSASLDQAHVCFIPAENSPQFLEISRWFSEPAIF